MGTSCYKPSAIKDIDKNIYIIAIVGESGTGKDHVLRSLDTLPDCEGFEFNPIISMTTRPQRDGERNHIDYYFVDEEGFMKEEFLETSNFNGWWYGTAMKALSNKCVNVGVFNPEGIRSLSDILDDDHYSIIRVRTSPEERLLRQLSRANNVAPAEIVRRYYTDEEDFKNFCYHWGGKYKTYDNNNELDAEVVRLQIAKLIWQYNGQIKSNNS